MNVGIEKYPWHMVFTFVLFGRKEGLGKRVEGLSIFTIMHISGVGGGFSRRSYRIAACIATRI